MMTQRYNRKFASRGFTLIEIILAIAILSIIMAVIISGMMDYVNYQRMQADVVEVSSQIRETRQNSLSAQDDTHYGVHFESDSVTIFDGDTYNALDPDNQVTSFSIVGLATDLTNGDSDIVFSRLTGVPSATGTITITSNQLGTTATITVNGTGLVD